MRPFVRLQDDVDPTLMADLIAAEAARLSLDRTFVSPFAKKANRFFIDYIGGCPDDLTVVVAQITD